MRQKICPEVSFKCLKHLKSASYVRILSEESCGVIIDAWENMRLDLEKIQTWTMTPLTIADSRQTYPLGIFASHFVKLLLVALI